MTQEQRTPLNQLGEFGLIQRIQNTTTLRNPEVITGIGDDCAVLDYGENYLLVTKDLLVEGIHFDLSYCPLMHLGYKAVAVNVSDICAMNGTAKHIVLGLGLSSKFTVEAVDEFMKGVEHACQEYNLDLIGGDTTTVPQGMMVSISAFGTVGKDQITYRSGARVNDLICVSGDLGGAYLGLQILEREKQVYLADPKMQPQLKEYEYILQRQLRPRARMDAIREFQEHGLVPGSMIDISDGLSSDLLHLCNNSNVSARIYSEKIPFHAQTVTVSKELGIAQEIAALNGGEDYELLFTIDQKQYPLLEKLAWIKVIGHITEPGSKPCLVGSQGQEMEIKGQGWNALDPK